MYYNKVYLIERGCIVVRKILCFIVFIFSVYTVYTYAAQSANPNNHIDAVLVIDTSNSMNGNDPMHIAVEGVKLFIDMLEHSGSRVGFVGFNGSVVSEIPLTEINTFQDKIDILDKVGKIKYTGYTDIGLALKTAESLLLNTQDKGNNQMILMFTDGFVEVDSKTGRTEQQSNQEIEDVLSSAMSNYPIYTIGLNSSDRVDKDLIDKIANQTSAKSYMTNNAEDLPEIFNEIFARHIKSNVINVGSVIADGTNYETFDINIPNPNIAEANIVLLSDSKLIDVRLTNPNNQNILLTQSNGIYYSNSSKYSVIKIVNPMQGDWVLHIKGAKGSQIKVNLIYNYDIVLEAKLPKDAKDVVKGETLNVSAFISDQNGTTLGSDLISSFSAELNVLNETGQIIEAVAMNHVKDNEFAAVCNIPNYDGQISIIVKAAGSGFYRESQPIVIDLENKPPKLENPISNKFYFYLPMAVLNSTINLNEVFNDPDNLEDLEYKITADKDYISFDESNGKAKIKTSKILNFGTAEVIIECIDPAKEKAEASFKIILIPILPFGLVILIVIGLIAIKAGKQKNIRLSGYIQCILSVDGVNGASEITNTQAYKGIVNMSQFVGEQVLEKLPELKKISFCQLTQSGSKLGELGGEAWEFKNKSRYKINKMMLELKDEKFVIVKGETFEIRELRSSDDENEGEVLIVTFIK